MSKVTQTLKQTKENMLSCFCFFQKLELRIWMN